MRTEFVLKTILILLMASRSYSQSIGNGKSDSINFRGTTVSGFSLCKITLSELNKLASEFSEVEVEEMDLSKNCYGKDSRFVNGKGYASNQYSGLIFQKDESSDLISKIRLTKDFKGSLPNGLQVDLSRLKLRDVFSMYPQFKDKWGSRGCSDYWTFSNDTISFYVKIDKDIKPQFPINEAFYLDKPVEAIDLVLSCYRILKKNNAPNVELLAPNEPLVFVDSIQVNSRFLESAYKVSDLVFINVYNNEDAIKLVGKEGKNGLIYITTKEAARAKYRKIFSSKSEDYLRKVNPLDDDSMVVYILNNKTLTNDIEAELYKIGLSDLLEIKVLNKKALKKKFDIEDRSFGVVITTHNGQ